MKKTHLLPACTIVSRLTIGHHWPGVPESGRWTKAHPMKALVIILLYAAFQQPSPPKTFQHVELPPDAHHTQ
jgi:hypothetical protein